MGYRRFGAGLTAAIIVAFSTLSVVAQQAPSSSGTATAGAFRTPWGEPDIQGIWHAGTLTPLERPARFVNRPVLTPKEAEALAAQVDSRPGRDKRSAKGTEADLGGAYNEVFSPYGGGTPQLLDGRTALIVDPPDGKIPPRSPEGAKREGAYEAYLRMLLAGSTGVPGTISPRRNEPPPLYNTRRSNRANDPEDRSTAERCFGGGLPFGNGAADFYRIVQSRGQVAVYHDAHQGQGAVRVIPVDGSGHLPAHIRLIDGDARGRWEGDTLVVDTANFSFKNDFRGSRENLHLIERFTRVSENRINYRVTVEDPTTWARPWTFDVAWRQQPSKANTVYESSCHEGNYGMVGLLAGRRASERLYAEGKGPNPESQNIVTGVGGAGAGKGGIGTEDQD